MKLQKYVVLTVICLVVTMIGTIALADDFSQRLSAAREAERVKDFVTAIWTLKDAIATFPSDAGVPQAYLMIGYAYLAIRNTGGDATTNLNNAEEAFRHVVTEYPASDLASEAQLRIGMIYMARRVPTKDHPGGIRQIGKAAVEFQALLDHYPTSKWASEAAVELAGIKLEDMLNGNGDIDTVLQLAKQVSDAYGQEKRVAAICGLLSAEAWFFSKRYDVAEPLAIEVVNSFPGEAKQANWARFIKARCQELTGRPGEALQSYEEVLGHVDKGEPCYSLDNIVRPGSSCSKAACLESLNRKSEALAAYRSVISRFPNSDEARTAATRLAALAQSL